jgi:hypothetical protein
MATTPFWRSIRTRAVFCGSRFSEFNVPPKVEGTLDFIDVEYEGVLDFVKSRSRYAAAGTRYSPTRRLSGGC